MRSAGYFKDYRRKKRAELIERLGGECRQCGSKRKLEFDHINGRDWEPREIGSTSRILLYVREAAIGKLQLLCRPCNIHKRDTQDRLRKIYAEAEEIF